MIITSVRGEGETQAAAPAKPEMFKDHNVVDGQVQRTWGEAFKFSSITSLQKAYDAQKQKDAAPKEEGYGWTTPFTWVGNVFSSVFGFIGDMVKSIFSICFNYSEEKAEKVEAEKKEDKTPKTEGK